MSDARDPINVFVGVDPRQKIAFNILATSIIWRSSRAVSLRPLILNTLPMKRRGLTQFTYSRFLAPYLCDFRGVSIFLDADIVVTGDIAELAACVDHTHDVYVMKSQPRFEWPSVMAFSNPRCRHLTPEYLDDASQNPLDLNWAKSIGELPPEWNHCVGYMEPKEAKLYHFTQGLPCWPETAGNHLEDEIWNAAYDEANSTVQWKDLMGGSVHAESTMKKYRARKSGQKYEIVTNANH